MQQIGPNDPEARSADGFVDNIKQLKTLFPEAFTQGKVDFDVLKQLLSGAVDEYQDKPHRHPGTARHRQRAEPLNESDG